VATKNAADAEPTKPSESSQHGSEGFEAASQPAFSITGDGSSSFVQPFEGSPLEFELPPIDVEKHARKQIMEETPKQEPTKPTEPSFEGFDGPASADSLATDFHLPIADPYAERMRAALLKISHTDYPAGMIVWLETAHPDLYTDLTAQIPDEINWLWNTHAPIEKFEEILDRLVSTHREGCRLYWEQRDVDRTLEAEE
jgi:hypothetical protein